ncbi:MAG: carbohydrate-binding domain-containing protein [Firmicutes bacterium]|nr:carbohydrate-binding domain-containing protein [Bacillota bacterium]
MKKNKFAAKGLAILLTLCMLLIPLPAGVYAADGTATLTFGNAAVTETVAGSGYSISGTTLTISSAGVYKITGSCEEGSIVVKGGVSDVVLILQDLTLKASSTAPVVVKKSSEVTIHTKGAVNLYDNEDPANETSSDAAVADAYEGAVIKVKSGSSATFCGNGTLNIYGNAKNGIKGAASSALVFADSGTTYHVTAVNNGIAADGSITIYDGTFAIDSENDGIKAVPDDTDTASAGSITIHDGTFDIDTEGDGIQAESELAIAGGTFDIKTFQGYDVSGTRYWNKTNNKKEDAAGTFDGGTMSCKGIKLAGDRGKENEIYITGGSFVINASDDAIHSAKNVVITGGEFSIDSGDDGIHADSAVTLGTQGGRDRDPDITVNHSYEGLEAANEYIISGRFRTYSVDDGINAAGGAGGSSEGFKPGGPGHHGGSAGNYSLEIAGGHVYVDCLGDGLDANGKISLTGGQITVFSKAAGGDDSPIDADGTITIKDAEVFTAGSAGVNGALKASCFGQNYYQNSRASYNAGTVVNVYSNSNLMYSDTLPRNVSYWMYTSPAMTSGNASITTGGAVAACSSNHWNHSWSSMTVKTAPAESAAGVGSFLCADCQRTEEVTLLYDKTYSCSGHGEEAGEPDQDEGYAVRFAVDEGVEGIDVYYTQDYSAADETGVTETVSRDSGTGEPCSNGDGQVNFQIRLKAGVSITDLSVTEGTYKNIKGPSDTGQKNLYRVTKITADTTITITTAACEHRSLSNPEWTWSSDYSAASVSFDCADCGERVSFDAIVISSLNDDHTIAFTAYYEDAAGKTYEDNKIADAFMVTFVKDEGVAGIDVYYTQDYITANETDVSEATARDADCGKPLVSGSGQVNFLIRLNSGYKVADVKGDANFKNLKGSSETGVGNLYRLTKITGDVTVTITTESGHVHDLTHMDRVEPTCLETGRAEHWYCAGCESSFADEQGTDLMETTELLIAAVGHDWDEGTVTTAPTCTKDGVRTYTCRNDSSHTYTEVIPASADSCPSAAFKDVDREQWYHDAVDYAVANKLMNGMAQDQFDPNGTTTRAMIVTILYRLEGEPDVSSASPFTDVESGSWYDHAVIWASANDIVNGYGEGRFGPNDKITREQFAAILYRFAKYKGYDVSAGADLSGYTDAASIGEWAQDAMKWANAAGLITGRTEKTLVPAGSATRAEAATILMRFIEGSKKS